MRNDFLVHHGILGQKWGVRRYQNSDGSLTELGRKRQNVRRNARTHDDVQSIVDSMSSKDKRQLGLTKKDNGQYLSIDEGEWVIKRILLKEKNTPVAFFDVYGDGRTANIALGVRGDKQGKGYGSKVTQKGMDWIDKNLSNYEHVEWSALESNVASQKLAEKHNFIHYKSRDYTNENGKYKGYIRRPSK